MTKDTPFLGIDFGTSQSSMAWFNPRTNQAEVIRNAEGEDKTPSVVYYGDGETLVGKPAEDLLENEHERGRILFSVKRHLAKPLRYSLGERHVRPVDVVADILRKLKRDAEEGHFHEPVGRAVITHPAVFDQLENDLLAEAARTAGFAEVVLLAEPVAAAIAYGEAGLNVGDHVLVYDLGGGTFDLALLNRGDADDPFTLAAQPRGLRCGGDDFDQALYDHCDAIAQQTLGRPIGTKDRRDLHFLRECRRRKENLSLRTRSEFSSYLPGGVQLKHAIDRESFEQLIGSTVQPTVSLTRSMVDEATSAGRQPKSVVLIGGSSQVPLVQRLLREALPIEPVKWQARDFAVALGAAYHARTLWMPRGHAPPTATSGSKINDEGAVVAGNPDLVKAESKGANPMDGQPTQVNDPAVAELVSRILSETAKHRFVFMMAGRTGTGKSSSINSLLGRQIAPVGDYEPTTVKVERFPAELAGIQMDVVDTPGLCDAVASEGNDATYLQMMSATVKHIDSLLFVTTLIETRIRPDEVRAIALLSRAFTPDIWKHAVIVFTFANEIIPPERFGEALKKRGELIRKLIAQHTGPEVAEKVPTVAVDNKSDRTLDGAHWRGALYTQIFTTARREGVIALAQATRDRIRFEEDDEPGPITRVRRRGDDDDRDDDRDIVLTRAQARTIESTIADAVGRYSIAGASVGRQMAGSFGESVGRTVGGIAGAAVGVFNWLRGK
jgi:actin-like ATPase involved in cell morphogenesis